MRLISEANGQEGHWNSPQGYIGNQVQMRLMSKELD
ncbi:unnamed protein product, partial [marine sediment metagenome]